MKTMTSAFLALAVLAGIAGRVLKQLMKSTRTTPSGSTSSLIAKTAEVRASKLDLS
jgi:hypothetical protein